MPQDDPWFERYQQLREGGMDRESASRIVRAERGAPRSERTGVGNFGRGAMLGLAKAGTSLGSGVGWILDKVGDIRPGEGVVDRAGQRLASAAQRSEEQAQEYWDPQGLSGTAGELAGRLVGEAGTTIASLGAGRAGALRVAPNALTRAQTAVRAALGGPRRAGAATAVLAEAPLSIARAADQASRGLQV